MEELCAWYDIRMHQGAKRQDYLFAIPQEKMPRIRKSLFDQINGYLRKAISGSDPTGGCHLHHLRHSAHSWLFSAMACNPGDAHLFPDLSETNKWMRDAQSNVALRRALYGHEYSDTRKTAFALARLAGHSSFDVTAGSYIHLISWMLAASLDKSGRMAPDRATVELATRIPESSLRRWMKEGDLHSIPLRLYIADHARGLALEAEREEEGEPEDWAISAWRSLLRHCISGAKRPDSPNLSNRAERAKFLRRQRCRGGAFRHEMEKSTPDLSQKEKTFRLACPLKPTHVRNILGANLRQAIDRMSGTNPELLKAAAGIFGVHAERGGWVRFDGISQSPECNQFLDFLLELGVGRKRIKLVSGDSRQGSAYINEWKRDLNLEERGLVIKDSGGNTNFTPKSALYIRPMFGSNMNAVDVGPAGYRFVMAMAFVEFGEIPKA